MKSTHIVPSAISRIRIADYCGNVFPLLGSKSATKKAIAARRLLLNGRPAKTGDFVQPGDHIVLKDSGVKSIKKYDIDLPIVYADDYLLLVNKPGGIAVNGNRYKTVENALADHNHDNPQPDALPRPVAVHRIDVPTCGLVLLAKTKTALIEMSRAFQQNKVDKTYIALIHGRPPSAMKITIPVDGKKAKTDLHLLRTVSSRVFGHLSMVELKPLTGRTHQLRIHLQEIGHPIVGDKQYNDNKTIQGKGLFLCAKAIRFAHPLSGEALEVEATVPGKFDRVLNREEQRY